MRLNRSADLSGLADAVRGCVGEVFFNTDEGDSLNLKSALSQFIFMGVMVGKELHLDGEILCADETDYARLSEYLIS